MIGEKVIHNTFGEGEITKVKKTKKYWRQHITVQFSHFKKLFIYPDAFEKFLYATNSEFQSTIEIAIYLKNTEVEKERLIAEHKLKNRMLQHFFNYTRLQLETLLEVKDSNNRYTKLMSGDVCGTDWESVFLSCVDAFGWDESEFLNFGRDTDNYSNVATPEGYSVWLLECENLSRRSEYDTKLRMTYEEKWWQECTHPTMDKRKKLIFAEKDDKILFMGVFEFVEVKRREMQDGKDDYMTRFNMVSEEYPLRSKF